MSKPAQPSPSLAHLALARITVGRDIFSDHGFKGSPNVGKGSLNLDILARSIDFFERMCGDTLGACLVRQKSKSQLRNMMHGENIAISHTCRAGANVDEDMLEEQLVKSCFGKCGYYGLGYVLGAFLALGIQSEDDMRNDPYGPVGPSNDMRQAWYNCSDHEWVEASPKLKGCEARGGNLERSPSANGLAYPIIVHRGVKGKPPPPDSFLRIGSVPVSDQGCETVFYALRGSVRIVLPHVGASYGDHAEVMQLCLPTDIAFGAEVVDVRMSYEFSVNPRRTPVDMSARDVATAFFEGRDAENLHLAILADVGSVGLDSGDLWIESNRTVVLALLRCAENMYLKSNNIMYHSSRLDPAAVQECKVAFEQSSLLRCWRAFKQQPQQEIFVYSCRAQAPEKSPLMGEEQVNAREEIHNRKRMRLQGGA